MYTPNFGGEARTIVSSTVNQAKGRFFTRPGVRSTILYFLAVILMFGLLGFLAHAIVINEFLPATVDVGLWVYLITLTLILLLGMIHASVQPSVFKWVKPNDYFMGTIIVLIVGLVGSLTLFFLTYTTKWFDSLNAQEFRGNVRPLTSAMMAFPLMVWAYEMYERIPPKIYKIWKYNPLIRLPNLTERDRNNTKVVTFVLDVNNNEPNPYDMRSKIPDVVLVDDGFKLTIDEDNRKNPNRMIQIANPRGEFFEWHFYIRRAWYKPYRFVDPYKTVEENALCDGDRIISRRRTPTTAPGRLGNGLSNAGGLGRNSAFGGGQAFGGGTGR